MYRISVCYGQPANPAAFDDHYTNIHAPLARKIPRLAEFTTGKCRSLMPDQPAPYYLVASLIFETAEDMKTGLRSDEMKATTADLANFADGGVTVYSQEEISRR